MNVERILREKGGTVYTIEVGASLAGALDVLCAHNIGALVVLAPDGGVAGILSERDVVRRINALGSNALATPISANMTAKPFTCAPTTTIDELMELMTSRRIRHVPVIDNGELAGVVSIGDVVKYKIDQAEREAAQLREYIAS